MRNKVLIIAEAGVNHNGSIEAAKQLIDAAAEAEVDYVKFQTFRASSLVTKNAKRAAYQDANSKDTESQYDMLKRLELNDEMHRILIEYCKRKGVRFLSTAFDLESIDYLKSLNLGLAKIPSGEITNLPYLRKIANNFEKIIMSTGMASISEIAEALSVLFNSGARKGSVSVVHCNSEYPTPMQDVNLKAMLHIKEEFGVEIGYSDHTLGIEVPIAAVALGAKVIEKHFTLDRDLPGPDHAASLEPSELRAMVQAIRNTEMAIGGNGIKEPSSSELKNKPIVRKSIVASREIAEGEIFTDSNITVKRPGEGISPMLWDEVIGQRANKSFEKDEYISLE